MFNQNEIETVKAAYNTILPLMVNLYGRWLDEREYEDINEYATPIKNNLPDGVTLVKMSKRPFGFIFTVDGSSNEYRFKINQTQASVVLS